jgi:hypothetical protein
MTKEVSVYKRSFFLLLVLLVLLALPLGAQFTTASFSGTVLDSTGAVLPAARLTMRNVDTGLVQTTTSDSAGAFLFSRLPVGAYELRAELAGFTTYVQQGLTLSVNQAATQIIRLDVGELTQEVTVEADAEIVVTRTGTIGQLVDQKRIVDLPLNGRMAQSLVYLAAGTVDLGRNACRICGHGGVYPGEITAGVNGAGMGQVNYQLDGAGHNDTYLNVNVPFPNPDALQEFNLQASNFTAQYGNAAGGIVNIVTRSGTNEIHGNVFEFLRNGALNARNFFSPTQDSLKRNQFGGSVGGPIVRNKLFYFGTFQGTRTRSAAGGVLAFVPTVAERSGDFSSLSRQIRDPLTGQVFPNNQIPQNRLSPVTSYLINNTIPAPNRTGRELNYAGTATIENENQFMIKADYNLDKHQISGRYFFTDFDQPPEIHSENLLALSSQAKAVRIQNVSLNHNYTVSPTLLINSTFGLNRQRGGSISTAPYSLYDAGSNIATTDRSQLEIPPELRFTVTGSFGVYTNHLGDFDRGDYTVRENVTKIQGSHEMHFGGEMVWLSNNNRNTNIMNGWTDFNGQLSGDGPADFMLGRASRFRQSGGEWKRVYGYRWSFYAQDDWRVNQRLTLNLGLRWDPYFQNHDRDGRIICFVPGAKSVRYPNAPLGLIFGGEDHDSGCPKAGFEPNLGNFAPRLGLAYRLTEDGKTSLRGGVGVFYTPLQTSNTNATATAAPFSPGFEFNDVAWEDPYTSAGVSNIFPEQYGPRVPGPEATFTLPTDFKSHFPSDFHIPVLYSWNLTLERQVGADWVLRSAYIGNKGTFLSTSRQLNPAVYIPGSSTVGSTQQRRLYQDFTNILQNQSAHNSSYHSLQLSGEKRFSEGLSVLANYTFSKTLDDTGWPNPYARDNYGLSSEDIRHNFKVSNLWEIPAPQFTGALGKILRGWALNSIWTWQSGFPMTISSGRDNSFTGVGQDRADYLGGEADLGSDRPHGEMVLRYFDTTRFAPNALGTFGNSGKNILRGPKFFNVDFGLVKVTNLSERTALHFRAEFFNLFNNVNFQLPNTNQSSGQFGRITGALSPRILQFAMKLQF